MLTPIPRAFHVRPGIALEELQRPARVEWSAVTANQRRLVIEGVALAGRTGHEKLHDPPRLGGMMQPAWRWPAGAGEQVILRQKTRQRYAAKTAARLPEELTPAQYGVPRHCRSRELGSILCSIHEHELIGVE